MDDYQKIFDLLQDNLKKIFFPEEWIALDLSISKAELFTLLLVDRYGEIIMSQLADYTRIPMSTATGLVDRLVKNGYLCRERSETDRRVVTIRLTEAGKEKTREFSQGIMRYIRLVYDALTEQERDILLKIFTKAMVALEREGSNEIEGSKDAKRLKKIEIE